MEAAGIRVDRGASEGPATLAFLPTRNADQPWEPAYQQGDPLSLSDVPEGYSPPARDRVGPARDLPVPEYREPDLEALGVSAATRALVIDGEGIEGWDDQTDSGLAYTAAVALLHEGVSDADVLRALATPGWAAGAKAYKERGGNDASRMAWARYILTWAKEKDPRAVPAPSVSEMFEEVEGAPVGEGHTYEDFFAHMPSGKFIFVPTREMWVASGVNASLPKVGGTDPTTVLRRTRPVHQLFWHPGEPEIVEGRVVQEGGWLEDNASRAFNRYLPPGPLPGGDASKAEPWVRHVRQLYPGEAEHIIDYFAFKVQHLGQKVNHGLVLGGGQGIGKDTLLDPVRRALGPWNVKDIAPQHLLGEFNPYVECVLLVISEARDMGEMNRFALYEHTKTLLAAPPDVLMMNDKHVKAVQAFNVLGAVFTTNHPTGGLYLPRDDRRHFVAWSEQTKDDFGPDYWNRIYGWYEGGGRAHVQEFLTKRDLSLFDPKAPPRKTDAWRAMVNSDVSPDEEDLSEILEGMGLPVVATLDQIITKAGELGFMEMEARLQAPAKIKATNHALARLGYSAVENQGAKSGKWTVQGSKRVVYGRRDHTYRQHWEAIQALPKLIPTAGS